MNSDRSDRRFYAVSYEDDTPTIGAGSLIPTGSLSFTPKRMLLSAPKPRVLLSNRVYVALAVAVLAFAGTVGSLSYLQVNPSEQLASVVTTEQTSPVIVENPYTKVQTPLTYGIQVAFTEPNFFIATRDAFIEAEKTFIEADLAAMKLRLFTDGVLTKEFPIVRKGIPGSFFETPAGLYQVDHKKKQHFVTSSQVYLPYSLSFQGNFYIHGTPIYETGDMTTSTNSGGIELTAADAEALYTLVPIGVPVLVYERASTPDTFLYEPKVPDLATPHYLIADVRSNTVLASSDLDEAVPIASLTKLMTAVVAVEYINMDERVQMHQGATVAQALIPRLAERSSVSMYSLLELLLLESSNEAADVIANEVGRNQFITYMNERAQTLGMTHTMFADPSGLSADNVSSVGDLLRLIQYIYEKRRFIIDMSAGKKLPDQYVSGEFSGLANFNTVSGTDNFIGGKIGETTAAKQTSVTLHTLRVKGEDRVIAIIILGSDGRDADVKALLHYAEERFGS